MDETKRPDNPPVGEDIEPEDRHATPFGLESSVPGVSVHGAEDEQDRPPPSAEDPDEARADDSPG